MSKRRLMGLVLALAMLFTLVVPAGILADEGEDAPVVEFAESAPAADPEPAPASDPEPAPPADPEPEIIELEVIELEVTEPEVTEPVVTEPEITEPVVTEPEITEPEPVEPEEGEPEEPTFMAGLATLTAGNLFADKWFREPAGMLNSSAVVYAVARASGEGELSSQDAIQVVANIDGAAKSFCVQFARLTWLTEEQAAAYTSAEHENGILYGDAMLDPVDYTAVAEEADEEIAIEDWIVEEPEAVQLTEEPAAEELEAEEQPEPEPYPAEVEEPSAVSDVEFADAIPITITAQPVDLNNPVVGHSYDLHVTAIGNSLTYRWYVSTDSGVTWKATKSAGYNTDTLTIVVAAKYEGYQYYCHIADAAGNTRDSAVSTVHLGSGDPIAINDQPTDIVPAIIGNSYDLHVAATGSGLSYRWYVSTDDGSTWKATKSVGYNTDTLTIVVAAKYEGYQYYCRITDSTGSTRDSAVVTVSLENDEPLAISEQPASINNAIVGSSYDLHVEATGTGLTYKWYVSTDDGSTWKATKSVGYNTDTLTIVVAAKYEGYKYYCHITDISGNTLDSAVATVHLGGGDAITISGQPANIDSAVIGNSYDLHVEATGTGLTYKWYVSTDGGSTWKATMSNGYNTSTLTLVVAKKYEGYKYYCHITDAAGNTLDSSVATVHLQITISQQPTDIDSAIIGNSYQLHVEATGGSLTYSWYVSTDGGSTWKATRSNGYNTSTLTIVIAAKYDGYRYYCHIANAAGSTLDSSVAVVHLASGDPIVITSQPTDITNAVIGNSYDLHVDATGSSLTYKWYVSTDGGATWKATMSNGYNTSTLTIVVAAKYDGYKYYCHIADNLGSALDTNVVTVNLQTDFTLDGVIYHILENNVSVSVVGLADTSLSTLVIPTTAKGYSVTEIGEAAFAGNTTLTSISLPNSITAIRARAFAGCTNLANMTNHD